jgi:hypothetical protein
MAVVYKAVIENPDFINKLADVLRANPGGLCGPRGATCYGEVRAGYGRAREDTEPKEEQECKN